MLKDLLNRVLELQNPTPLELGGKLYTTKPVVPVKAPEADTLHVATLSGLVDYLTDNVDKLDLPKTIIHVENESTVRVVSALYGDFRQRETLLVAKADLLQMQFNAWLDSERFNIFMQACFLPDEATHRAEILRIIGNIQQGATMNVLDDGVSQETVVKTGIARVGNATIPNPVTLRPYRTFNEVEQPTSQFVFRMQEGPKCMLVEADGGAWRNVARKNVKNYLEFELAQLGEDAPRIIA